PSRGVRHSASPHRRPRKAAGNRGNYPQKRSTRYSAAPPQTRKRAPTTPQNSTHAISWFEILHRDRLACERFARPLALLPRHFEPRLRGDMPRVEPERMPARRQADHSTPLLARPARDVVDESRLVQEQHRAAIARHVERVVAVVSRVKVTREREPARFRVEQRRADAL